MNAGTYLFECVEIELGLTNDEKPQVGIACQIVDESDAKGETLTAYLYFTEKTIGATMRTLRALGLKGDDLSTDLQQCVGGRMPGLVTYEDDLEGNPRARLRLGGGGVAMKNIMSPEQKKAFALGVQAKLAAVKPIEKPANATAPTPGGGTGGGGGEKFFE